MTESEAVKLDKQLGKLEETVAAGFHEVGQRFDKLEAKVTQGFHEVGQRFDKLEGKVREHGQRFDKLEAKVTQGFQEHGQRLTKLEDRMTGLEARMGALGEKFDVLADTVLDATKTVLERIDGLGRQMERSTKAIRRRHTADRRLTRLVLAGHGRRLTRMETRPQA